MIKSTKTTHILLIALAVVIIYSNSLKFDFAWDDTFLIKDNPYVKNWHNIGTVFTEQVYYGANKNSNYYRPLQLVSYITDYSIWKLNPFGYHFTNLSLHTINSILAYFLILAVSGSSVISLLTALLFASAPVISSATYYISARADLLASMFILFSLLTFARFYKKKKSYLYICSILSFMLALLSRENAIILPFLLMVSPFYDRKTGFKSRMKYISGHIIVLLIYILLRATILNFNTGPSRFIAGGYVAETPLLYRLLTDFKVLALYLRLLIFPFGLHMDWFIKPAGSIFQPDILLSIGIVGLVAIFVKKASRNHPQILFGVAWFFIALLPLLNIFPLSVFLHEMWLYLPSIGFFFAVSIILLEVIRKRLGRIITCSVIIIFLLYFATLTIANGRVWRNSTSLFKNTIKYNTANPYIYLTHANLALAYFDNGKHKEAVKECEYAVSLKPDFSGGYNNLGIFHSGGADYINAIKNFKISIKSDENNPAAYLNLALTYNKLGYYQKAIKAIARSIELSPRYFKPYCTLGLIYFNMNKFDKAERVFIKALALNRDSFEANYYLGSLYFKKGKLEEALKKYKICLHLNEGGAEFYNNLALLYIRLRKFKEAENALIYAKELDDTYVASYNNLGNLYSAFHMFDLAILEYKKALSLEPDNLKIRSNLAKTYKDLHRTSKNK